MNNSLLEYQITPMQRDIERIRQFYWTLLRCIGLYNFDFPSENERIAIEQTIATAYAFNVMFSQN